MWFQEESVKLTGPKHSEVVQIYGKQVMNIRVGGGRYQKKR